ncbi:substrate-binding domain-containing protein [Sorangium sp. So ce131]|uniref:substrate-binding domain-containing protein n=1 Tax=Sorangium sp. So ce131 TaxID=3133282 RepID=UPI003F5D883D
MMLRIGRCWMAALGLVLATAACGSDDTSGTNQQAAPIKRPRTLENEFTPVELEAMIDDLVAEINEGPIKPMQMTVLLKTIEAFFAPVATGASRAMGELGVTGNVIGAQAVTNDQAAKSEYQNDQIAQTVLDGAEGIGISPFGDDNAAAIDEAIAEGVHVVTLDSDVAQSKRALYVGTINEPAGAAAAATLLKLLPKETPGTVVIHGSTDPTWAPGLERTRGARTVLEQAGYSVVVRSVTWGEGGEDGDVEWMRNEIETADPPVVGLLGLFDVSYWCALAAEAAGKPELPVVAFDFNPKTVDYMNKGLIQATHVQRQYYEGYLVPYILYGINSLGLKATKAILDRHDAMIDGDLVNLGIDVVPGDKVDAYSAFLDEIGATQ